MKVQGPVGAPDLGVLRAGDLQVQRDEAHVAGPGVPVPVQVAGVEAGAPQGCATPIDTPWKLSVLVTPRASVTTSLGAPQELELNGVPQTERVHAAGMPLQA